MKKLAVILLSLLFAAPASAHTVLVSSNPASAADLSEAPAEVRLSFTESLLILGEANPNKLEVFNSSGELISGEVTVAGPEIFVPIKSEFAFSGDYTVKYRVVSADGHPVEDQYNFTVTGPEVISAPIIEEPEDGPNLLIRFIWVLLALSGIGLFALVRLRK